jgi:hypothetical protein
MHNIVLIFAGREHVIAPLLANEVRLMFNFFFRESALRGNLAVLPPFDQLISNIMCGKFNDLSPLPTRYTASTPVPVPPFGGDGGGGGGGRGGGGGAPHPANEQNRNAPVTNLAPNRQLMARYSAAGSPGMGTLTTSENRARSPLNQDGLPAGLTTEVCLTWTLKGSCIAGCGRKSAHRALTPTETARVTAFLDIVLT